MKNLKLYLIALAAAAFVLTGCSSTPTRTDGRQGSYDQGFSLDDYQMAQKAFPVRTAGPNENLDTNSYEIVNVPAKVALSKAFQALQNYDHALAKRLGYDFDLNTVFQPDSDHLTSQILDGHQIYATMLTYRSGAEDQAAFNDLTGISPGWIEIDAVDETKPAVVHLTNASGVPYKIKLNFRNINSDPNYIGRWLANKGLGNVPGFTSLDGADPYIDDVTPEIKDGTHDIYFTSTLNQRKVQNTGNPWYWPTVQKTILVNAETEDVQTFTDPKKVPTWVDRIYSEDLVSQYITRAFFNAKNYQRYSYRGTLVVDGIQTYSPGGFNNVTSYRGGLEVVLNAKGDKLYYVAIMTSAEHDNTANGLVMVSTRDLSDATFYPAVSNNQMTTREQAQQVMNAAVSNHPGWYVTALTVQYLYGKLTWEGTYVHPNKFAMQEGAEGGDKVIDGEMIQGFGLAMANNDMDPDHVMVDPNRSAAYDKYENYVFIRQVPGPGSNSLQEFEADGTIQTIKPPVVDQGQSTYLFTLAEPRYQGIWFRMTVVSAFDRSSIDIMSAGKGDHVQFKYGDNKTSPTSFVKQFKDLSSGASKTGTVGQ